MPRFASFGQSFSEEKICL